jgi:hypothetical protein
MTDLARALFPALPLAHLVSASGDVDCIALPEQLIVRLGRDAESSPDEPAHPTALVSPGGCAVASSNRPNGSSPDPTVPT